MTGKKRKARKAEPKPKPKRKGARELLNVPENATDTAAALALNRVRAAGLSPKEPDAGRHPRAMGGIRVAFQRGIRRDWRE